MIYTDWPFKEKFADLCSLSFVVPNLQHQYQHLLWKPVRNAKSSVSLIKQNLHVNEITK